MKYFEHLEANMKATTEQLELIFTKHAVEPVGWGYIDCIVQKSHLVDFIQDLSILGIVISDCSWWCYVDTSISKETGCPHGLGGPKSEYYEGWYSELQNEMLSIHDDLLKSVLNSFDRDLIASINNNFLNSIYEMLKVPFRFTPTEYIAENRCVTPALWLLVPDDWRRE